MAEASVEIPPGLAVRVRASLVLLYEASAEGLHLALRAQPERDPPAEDVRAQRDRLAGLDALLVQIGWWAEPGVGAGAEPVELSGPLELLHDAVHGALIDAGERLALSCGERWRADVGLEDVRAAAAEVMALDKLLGRLATGPTPR
jgi:hypothetical protein